MHSAAVGASDEAGVCPGDSASSRTVLRGAWALTDPGQIYNPYLDVAQGPRVRALPGAVCILRPSASYKFMALM